MVGKEMVPARDAQRALWVWRKNLRLEQQEEGIAQETRGQASQRWEELRDLVAFLQ